MTSYVAHMTPQEHTASRRTVLTALAAAATVGAPLLSQLAAATPAYAADRYASNTALYQALAGEEGTTFGRRYRRHERTDTRLDTVYPFPRTAVLALHGGGIESGTSELCLAVAGYSPREPEGAPILAQTHDYWMFEGLMSSGNKEALHVTASHCDDHVALATAAGHLNVLSLHGCSFDSLGLPVPANGDRRMAVVGGLNADFRAALVAELTAAGFPAVDAFDPAHAAGLTEFNGDHPLNPCNRTMLGRGAQLELTTELRSSLFGDASSRSRRAETWDAPGAGLIPFREACRRAIATVEAAQPVL